MGTRVHRLYLSKTEPLIDLNSLVLWFEEYKLEFNYNYNYEIVDGMNPRSFYVDIPGDDLALLLRLTWGQYVHY